MLTRLVAVFVLVPLLELALLIQVGRWIGLLPTVGLVFTTGVLGAALARREGLRTLSAFQRELSVGRLPGGALMDGLAILLGGAFLLTPGILTDLLGFLLLVPVSRRVIQNEVRKQLEARVASGDIQVRVVETTLHR